ncbi:MAG: asparagine synthase (glutamine-hydrolyzing) [Haliscomenobacteraceae bacterium CHB4]|nr:Asparagine synthetase [glutamine-hydrolyzing] 1 [Saprospiraceae bacterium]MCE7926250.1 asparagine synthase (glutamine-hydrolyzing) [Haliscomenobacteraceae bacterium CHB4]
MCGISGIIHLDRSPVPESQIWDMIKAMKHRGPNDNGTFFEDGIGFGFVRLSIIDLSPAGHQPMFSHDERYVIIFNGEIFNYVELREELIAKGHRFRTKTDTEVLITSYVEWGEDMLHRLNGMWTFVIYDRKEKTVFGSRDRYGIKPLYYCIDGNRLLFASEIPSILAVLGRKPTADQNALFDFLIFNRTDQDENTFFSEIKKINHGCYFKLRVAPGQGDVRKAMQITKWYDLRKELKEPFKDPEEFREMFVSSIALRLRSDVPIGVCLSGGLDSSSIVTTMIKDFDKRDVHTFSAVYGEGKFGDESKFIHLYKDELPNMHYIMPDDKTIMADIPEMVRAHAEPIASTGPYAQYKVMELAKDHVTVTLDGQGADEMLAGYHYFFGFHFKNLLLKGKLGGMASEMFSYYRKHRSMLGLISFILFMLPAGVRARARAMEKGYIDEEFFSAHAVNANSIAGELYGSATLQDALINHFEYKLEHLLKWEDRNSMWFSLEARVPFLDHRLVERTITMPDNMIIRDGMTKHVLREAMKGRLPEPIRMRRDKIGFGTPHDEWFRTPAFQEYIKGIIHAPSFASRGLVDVKKVQSLYNQHVRREGNHGKEIWKWLHLENWFNKFID